MTSNEPNALGATKKELPDRVQIVIDQCTLALASLAERIQVIWEEDEDVQGQA